MGVAQPGEMADSTDGEKKEEEVPMVGEIAPPPTGGRRPMEGRVIRGTKGQCLGGLQIES